jgi:hypothetical protein
MNTPLGMLMGIFADRLASIDVCGAGVIMLVDSF